MFFQGWLLFSRVDTVLRVDAVSRVDAVWRVDAVSKVDTVEGGRCITSTVHI